MANNQTIWWRCRGCSESQDREAPRRAVPHCGGCGKLMVPFDVPPEPVVLKGSKKRKATHGKQRAAEQKWRVAKEVQPAHQRIAQNSMQDLGREVSKLRQEMTDLKQQVAYLEAIVRAERAERGHGSQQRPHTPPQPVS